jgi:transposase
VVSHVHNWIKATAKKAMTLPYERAKQAPKACSGSTRDGCVQIVTTQVRTGRKDSEL